MQEISRSNPAENCAAALRAATRLRWPCILYFKPLHNRLPRRSTDVQVTAGDGDYNVFPAEPWKCEGKLLTGKQYSDELQHRIRIAAFW